MKKTFTPMARAEKATHVFRKKTLNVTDDLNIKHDADDLENVDDYWTAAASMIENRTIDSIDDTAITEQSDTLFDLQNIRRSIKADEGATKRRPALEKKSPITEELSRDKPAFEDSAIVSVEAPAESTLKIASSESFEAVDHLPPDSDSLGNSYFASAPMDEGPDVLGPESETKENILGNITHEQRDKNETVKTTHKMPKQIFLKSKARAGTRPKAAVLSKPSDRPVPKIQNVRELAVSNKVSPLTCTSEINTAVMDLSYLSFTNPESSEKSFSLFVVKGTISIELGGMQILMKKDDSTVIDENTVYSIRCISSGGATLFISYAL